MVARINHDNDDDDDDDDVNALHIIQKKRMGKMVLSMYYGAKSRI